MKVARWLEEKLDGMDLEMLREMVELLKGEVRVRDEELAYAEEELRTLRADKERLDWLGVRTGHAQNLFQAWFKCGVGADIRSEIDKAKVE